MKLRMHEFFGLLRKGLRLRGSNTHCGDVFIEKKKGKRFLVMRWPEDDRVELDEYGDFIPPVKPELRVPFDKFEDFACRMFAGAEFFMELSDVE